MTNPDLISVIIPTYNRAALLLQALESVRRQTWPHVQIIVADDGSVDNTAELVSKMPDVCYVHQENRGQGAARNLGLKCVEGAFVCSLDADDLWEPDFLEQSMRAIRTLNVDFVFSNWLGETADGERYPSYFEQSYGWQDYQESELDGWRILEAQQVRDIYIEACPSPSSSLVLPRELIPNGWLETLRIADDWCLLLDTVLRKPCRVAVCTRPRWIKRVVGDNIYDQHDYMEVKRDFYVHDFRMILKRFSSVMTPHEGALFCARIAFHQASLAKWELQRCHVACVPGLLIGAATSTVGAFCNSPGAIFKRVRKRAARRRSDEAQLVTPSHVESNPAHTIARKL